MSSMFYFVSHTVQFLVPGLLFPYKNNIKCVTFLTHTMSSMFYFVSHTVKFLVPGLLFLYKKQYKTCTRVLKKLK